MQSSSDSCPVIKLSHKQRKALQKKLKRKSQRQQIAKRRDEQLQKEEERKKLSPNYQARLRQEEYEHHMTILHIEEESRRQHELWVWSEERWAEQQRQKKEQEERERLLKIEIEKKIKEEWEERQKKEQEEEEERRKKKEKQAALLQQARDAENKGGDWHNPIAPAGKERETCPFFAKVGACRFGERCSRSHPYPETSTVVMFASMFSHFRLDQGLCEEFDTDIVLEYEDSELYQQFKDFYEDVLPEFKNVGEVVQFKVCCNYQSHLRGNVYIQFAREEDAVQAYGKFNARWYGGKQLSGEFVTIPSWRSAICGLFGKGRCPKGRECNFLHVFHNPGNEFWQADRGFQTPARHERWRSDRYTDRNRYRRPRSRSRERQRGRSRSHSRSRSSYSRHRYSRSRSRDRHKRSKYRKSKYSRSKSRSRSRSYSRSRSSSRSRSKERKPRKNYRSRDYSKSRSRSGSRSRSREKYSNDNRKKQYQKSDKITNISASNGVSSKNVNTPDRQSVLRSQSRSRSRSKERKGHKSRSRSQSRSRSDSRDRKGHKKHKKNKHKKHKR